MKRKDDVDDKKSATFNESAVIIFFFNFLNCIFPYLFISIKKESSNMKKNHDKM